MNIHSIESQIETEELNQLLNRSFPVPTGARFFDDFPVWDPALRPDSQVKRFGAFAEDGKLLSSAGARLARLRAPHGILPVAVIGAVATDSSVRGQGFASNIVAHAAQWAESEGAALLLLWGSEHSMYEKLGFQLCGKQLRGRLDDLSVRKTQCVIKQGFTRDIFELQKKRATGFVLENSDYRWLSAHKNTDWYSAWDGDRVVAYAAIGRGIDLQNIVHEWGGEIGPLVHLLAEIALIYPGAEILCSPDDPLRVRLAPIGLEEFLCLAKISKPEVVAAHWGEKEISLFQSAPITFSHYSLWVWGLDAA